MGSESSARKRGFPSRKSVFFSAAVCGAAALAALVFMLARIEGRVPSLPRASFSKTEIDRAMDELQSRVARFQPSARDEQLEQLLVRWHIAETSDVSKPSAVDELSIAASGFQETAKKLASEDEARYLLLGDKLALEFDRAFFDALKEAKAIGLERMLSSGAPAAQEIRRRGGSFFEQCIERGMVREDGALNAPRIVPEVLFRVRWRHMGGLDKLDGISDVEKRAYYDFTAAYSKSSADKRRLAAVEWLGRSISSYDAVVARAVVLFDAGRYSDARDALQKALDSGRNDAAIKSFIRALPL